jgi:hypothetical protein
MSDSYDVFGNVYKENINDLINNDKFKELRKQMLNGEKPKACTRCYELETSADSWTLRKNSLESFKHHMPLLEQTNEDGSIKEFIYYFHDFSRWYYMNQQAIERDIKINDVLKSKK